MTWIVAIVPRDDPDTMDPYGMIAVGAELDAVTAVVAGRAPSEQASTIAFAQGAVAVMRLGHADLSVPAQTDQLVVLLAALIDREPGWRNEPALFLLPAGQVGEALAARLAARLDGVTLGRCQFVALSGADVVAEHAAHGGRVVLTLATSGFPCFLAIRRPDDLVVRSQPPAPVH